MKDTLGQEITIGCNVVYVLEYNYGISNVPRKVIGMTNHKKDYVVLNMSDYSYKPMRKLAKNVLVVDKLLGGE